MRKWLIGLLLLASPALAANNPSLLPNIPSIAALDNPAVINPVQGETVNLQAYYAGNGNLGGGVFQWNASSTTTADSCTVFQQTGVTTGRWIRQLTTPLDVTMCGAKADGSTDDSSAITQAFTVASTTPYKTLTFPGGHIVVNSSVTAAQGVKAIGQGMGTPGAGGSYVGQTFIDGSGMSSGWVFNITTPNGTTELEAPKYYDMTIEASQAGGNPTGGCIRWNSATGGFTNDSSSQYYMIHPHAERIYCLMNSGSSNVQIGIQCSKCFDGDISQSVVFFGEYGIDLEGSDIVSIGGAGPNRVQGAINCLVTLVSHSAFGNKDRVVGNELLSPSDFGQTYNGMVCTSALSSVIESNHIEGSIAGGLCGITVTGGMGHEIIGNDVVALTTGSTQVPHWLCVAGNYQNINVLNNVCVGCDFNSASFTGATTALYYYNNGGVRQIITHSGNGNNGDSGFPFNTYASSTDSVPFPPTVVAQYNCGLDGLNYIALGQTIYCVNGAFDMPPNGSSAYLDFSNVNGVPPVGTVTMKALAYCKTSTCQLEGAVTDNGTVVGSFTGQNLTDAPAWYTFATGASTSTKAGARLYVSTGGNNVELLQVTLSN